MAVALDPGVIVGFLDANDTLHEAADTAIREVLDDQRLVVSAVTYAEVLTGARLGHHDEEQVTGFFRQLVSTILPVAASVADTAADLRARFKSLRMPDALILAAAEVDPETDLMLTTDRQMAKVSGLSVRVRLLG